MKNTLSIAAALLITALCPKVYAQDMAGCQEFSASYGTTSGTDMIQGFYLNRGRANFDHPSYYDATSKTGNLFLTYRYSVCKRLSIGITLGAEHVDFDHYSNPHFGDPVLLGKYKAGITTMAFELKPVYLNSEYVQLYALIGIGARYYDQTQTAGSPAGTSDNVWLPKYMLNSQWTPIGIRVGKNIGGYAELGVGYKGLANIGCYYKINRKHIAVANE